MKRLVVAAPPGPTRERLVAFFAPRLELCSLERERLVEEQLLLLNDSQLLVRGQDLLTGTMGAVILDSGFMAPMPRLCPSEAEWEGVRGQFDQYLRSERERDSFWYSAMAILNDRLPCCVNRQAAFAAAAMKPWAWLSLMDASVPILPFVASNDPAVLKSFVAAQGGACRRLPWFPGEEPSWVTDADLDQLPVTAEPVMLQAADERGPALHLHAVGGALFTVHGSGAKAEEIDALARWTGPLRQLLCLEWAELWFLPWQGQWHLADFSPAPRLEQLPDRVADALLERLWRTLQRGAEWGPP